MPRPSYTTCGSGWASASRPGIEIGNESAGLVTDPSLTPWQPIDLANHAFGQGVAVTPLQLVRAFAAMANGGNLVQPHIYTATTPMAAATVHQVISAQLSDTLRQLMIHVVDAGPNYAEDTQDLRATSSAARPARPRSGISKTDAWLPDTYNHTFVGFVGNPDAGGDHPRPHSRHDPARARSVGA